MEEENKKEKEDAKTEVKVETKKSFKERWKENWNKTDELCSQCGSVTKLAKGLNRQNMKRLFLSMPKASDWLTLFIIAMVIFMAWAYNRDIQISRGYINNIDTICLQRQAVQANMSNLHSQDSIWNVNITNIANETNETDKTDKIDEIDANVYVNATVNETKLNETWKNITGNATVSNKTT